jgi:hypothetical protein
MKISNVKLFKYMLVMIISFTGCSSNDVIETDSEDGKETIIGTWTLIQSYSNPTTANGWSDVTDGFEITVTNSNTYISSPFTECTNGAITVYSEEIEFNYRCFNFTAGYESPNGVFKYSYSFIDGLLELRPLNFSCFEGCKSRFTIVE